MGMKGAGKKAYQTRMRKGLLKGEIEELKREGFSTAKIAKKLNVSAGFVSSVLKGQGIQPKPPEPKKKVKLSLNEEEHELIEQFRTTGTIPDAYVVHSDRNTVKLEARYREVRRLYQAALREIDISNQKVSTLTSLESESTHKAIIRLEKKRAKGKSESVAVALASDWHIEESIEPDSVNGLNEYNLDIAKTRVKKFFEQTVYLVDLMSHKTNIDTLVLALLGDMMSGYIHEELMESNHLSPVEAVIFLGKLLRDGIDFLKKECSVKDIILPCSYGNHGRSTQKRRISTGHKNSYEFLLYSFLAASYEHDPAVHFHVSKGYHNYLNVFGKYLIRFHHGDNIRYAGGVGGIAIPVNKAVAQWSRAKPAYLDCFGHFHQSLSGNRWICNGSLVGYNPYAISIKADYERPQQVFFVLEKDLGLTFTGPIFVE